VPAPEPDPFPAEPPTSRWGFFRGIQNRILSGLLLALPIVLTIWILYWLYITVDNLLLDPVARLLARQEIGGRVKEEMPLWYRRVVAPIIAVSGVLTLLYLLGWLVRSRVARVIDWVFLKVPGVTLIYQALSNLIKSFESQRQANRFKRVVLVTYPHPGIRSLGLVTNSLRDRATGRPILCVCVLTGVFPPTGFTLFVPEDDVTDLDWTVNQTFQAILSGGITSPPTIAYFPAPPGAEDATPATESRP
jgi:uncharacterized membrane protein